MTPPDGRSSRRLLRYRFSDFSFDAETGELWRGESPIPLPPQATHVLHLLLERAGELVTRAEIEERLWPDPTHVEADLSINYVIRRIRAALGDSATNSHFVETLPRRGYRFKPTVEREPTKPYEEARGESAFTAARAPRQRRQQGGLLRWLSAATVVTVALALHSLPSESGETGTITALRSGMVVAHTTRKSATAELPASARERYLQAKSLLAALPANDVALRSERVSRIERAIRLLDATLAEAPDFAAGWAALADAHVWSDLWLPGESWVPRAEAAVERCLALDPEEPTGLAIAADLALRTARDWERAEALSQRALLHGGDAGRAHLVRAEVLAAAGRLDEARRHVEVARQLSPLDWLVAYTEPIYALLDHDYAAAERQLTLLREARPADQVLAMTLIQALELQGKSSGALRVARDYLHHSGWTGALPASLTEYWSAIHRVAEARSRREDVSVYWRAVALTGQGRYPEAAELLRQGACGDPRSGLTYLHVSPYLRRLSGLADYEAAVLCVGMPDRRSSAPRMG